MSRRPSESIPGGSSRRRYQFGEFVLDLGAGFLRRNGEEVPLRPKTFEVLAYLVQHQGALVSKGDLIDAVWTNTSVTDNSLSQCLSELRRALDDDTQTVIRTVARRGFVFQAPVSDGAEETPTEVGPVPTNVHLPEETKRRHPRWQLAAAIVALVAAGVMASAVLSRSDRLPELVLNQLTDFTDSAMAPAVSPDGRMLAFIRGDSAFRNPDQVWVKLLPSGTPVRLTDVRGVKYGPAFSSDGGRITFTVSGQSQGWRTFSVPVLGGEEAQPLLANAAGLTWIDSDHVLFSEIGTGMHMGIATSRVNRSEARRVYFPPHERSMAHYSSLSPDGRSVLVVEMNDVDAWVPCRIVAFDASGDARQAGPDGACGAAAWSPDGRWMYFSVQQDGHTQLWRQRYPDGSPQQITFGPDDHEGVAVFPDGSLATSIGIAESAVWVKTADGEYPITSSGKASPAVTQGMSSRPLFSRDGRRLYYLLRRSSDDTSTELHRYDLTSKVDENLLSGFSIDEFDVSSDDADVVFSLRPTGRPAEIWVAPLDHATPALRISAEGDGAPHFGPSGDVVFKMSDGAANFIARMKKDGSGRSPILTSSISSVLGISWDRNWVVVYAPVTIAGRDAAVAGTDDVIGEGLATFAVPIDGGHPVRLCSQFCVTQWAPDGSALYLTLNAPARSEATETIMIPLPSGTTVPALPKAGLRRGDLGEGLGATVIRGGSDTADLRVRGFSPSTKPTTFAYVRSSVHHNLFQIRLR